MLIKGGYYFLDDKEKNIDIVPEEYEMFVLSAGHTKIAASPFISTQRQFRKDYQLIYNVGGPLHYFDEAGNEYIAPKNSFLLYKPYEYQDYTFFKEENTEIYWVHFGGNFVEDFLDIHNLKDKRVITLPPKRRYLQLYGLMRSALDERIEYFVELCIIYLQELIVSIASEINNKVNSMPQNFAAVLNYIQGHYYEKITVEQLAKIGATNPKTLTRHFLKYCGMTPIKYVNNLRVQKAKVLLVRTNHKINGISLAMGFEEPLYFSSVFRSITGVSPREYRNKHKQR